MNESSLGKRVDVPSEREELPLKEAKTQAIGELDNAVLATPPVVATVTQIPTIDSESKVYLRPPSHAKSSRIGDKFQAVIE